MNTLAKLKRYLEQNNAPYEVLVHEEVYTAQELAQALHTPGRALVKAVVVKTDGGYAMAVLPASRRIDFTALREVVGAPALALASEKELAALFPEAEIGAMPPFGNLYNLPVFVDESLLADEYIAFNAGTHYEAVRMLFRDFERLVKPRVASFGIPL